jgi:hypothetical protein
LRCNEDEEYEVDSCELGGLADFVWVFGDSSMFAGAFPLPLFLDLANLALANLASRLPPSRGDPGFFSFSFSLSLSLSFFVFRCFSSFDNVRDRALLFRLGDVMMLLVLFVFGANVYPKWQSYLLAKQCGMCSKLTEELNARCVTKE